MLKRRRSIAVILIFIIFTACKDKEPTEGRTFKVSGTLTNSRAKKVYLEQIGMLNMQPTVVDSSTITNDGKYRLSANSNKDMVYTIRLDQNQFPAITLINDTTPVIVNATFPAASNQYVEKYDITGSPASLQFREFITTLANTVIELYGQANKNDSSTAAKRKQSADHLKTFTVAAIKNATNPALGMYILSYYQTYCNQNQGLGLSSIDNDEVFSLIGEVASRFPANKDVVALKENFELQRRQQEQQAQAELARQTQWIGKPAPEIRMQDPIGKTIALSSFKGKYVLVDFWASWCRPCRAENPNVVSAFQKFRAKNFTILGVSLDKNKDAWTKAIMKDGLTWTHISDLQEWSSPVVPLYSIQGIPYNVLVDPQGTIVAQNLRGPQLHEKLSTVLQ